MQSSASNSGKREVSTTLEERLLQTQRGLGPPGALKLDSTTFRPKMNASSRLRPRCQAPSQRPTCPSGRVLEASSERGLRAPVTCGCPEDVACPL